MHNCFSGLQMIAGFKNTRVRHLGLAGERKNEGIYNTFSCVTASEIAVFDPAESCAEFVFLVHSRKYVILLSREQYNQIVHLRRTYFVSMATTREHQESSLVHILL